MPVSKVLISCQIDSRCVQQQGRNSSIIKDSPGSQSCGSQRSSSGKDLCDKEFDSNQDVLVF